MLIFFHSRLDTVTRGIIPHLITILISLMSIMHHPRSITGLIHPITSDIIHTGPIMDTVTITGRESITMENTGMEIVQVITDIAAEYFQD